MNGDTVRPPTATRPLHKRKREGQRDISEEERGVRATECEEHKRARRGERARAAWEDDYRPAEESADEELWGMCVFADAPEWEGTL